MTTQRLNLGRTNWTLSLAYQYFPDVELSEYQRTRMLEASEASDCGDAQEIFRAAIDKGRTFNEELIWTWLCLGNYECKPNEVKVAAVEAPVTRPNYPEYPMSKITCNDGVSK
jgi:hypothetical protein